MGNICRSPMAHGVFRKLVRDEGFADDIDIESSGTHDYHVGQPPDYRAQEVAHEHGIDLSDLRARKVRPSDFEHFNYVLAMDDDNYSVLSSICPSQYQSRLHMFLKFSGQAGMREVPDPYYGGADGFHKVFNLVETGARGLFNDIKRNYFE